MLIFRYKKFIFTGLLKFLLVIHTYYNFIFQTIAFRTVPPVPTIVRAAGIEPGILSTVGESVTLHMRYLVTPSFSSPLPSPPFINESSRHTVL